MKYIRNIELSALKDMAKAACGDIGKYTVERTSEHRVRIAYVNIFYPHDKPIVAFFPCYKADGEWWVVNMITHITGCYDDRHKFFSNRHFGWTSTAMEVSNGR